MRKVDGNYLLDHSTNKGTTGSILFGLSLLTLLGMSIVIILQIDTRNNREAWILAAGMIPILVAIGFIHRKKFELAGALIAGSLTIIITILATIGQGVYDIGTMAFPAILIIVSLILKRNIVIYLTGIIILCNAWLVFGATYGIYQPDYPDQSYNQLFIITSLILLITMAAVYILSNTVRNSLSASQKELVERRKAEQALREAETMYRALVEKTSVVIYKDMPDKHARVIYISPQIEDLTGYTQSEWCEDPYFWKSIVHSDDLPRVLDEVGEYIVTGQKTISEYRLKKKSGAYIWVRDEAIVIKDEAGTPQYVHGVYIDITEQKTAELKVQQREAIISAVAETIQLLLKSDSWQKEVNTILRLLGQATGASHAYLFENQPGSDGVMLSSQRHEWAAPGMTADLGNHIYQNTRPDSIPGFEDWHKNLSAGRPFYGSREQYPRYWKKVFDASGLKTLLDMPIFVNGEWWGTIGFDDFTNEMPWSQVEINALAAAAGSLGTVIEQQITDEGLRASEEKFNLAFQHTHAAMAISKISDQTLLDVNPAFCRITGYSREESIGKRAGRDLNIWVAQDDRNNIFSILERQGYVEEYKAQFRLKNGEINVGLLSAVNITIAGEPCQLYAFVDISSIDQLLNELKAKNEELQSFTYTVSHDLKAPLVTISGFMGYLEQDARNGDIEKLNKDILRINEAITKMQRLLNELLELSRIGRMMNAPEKVSFGEIVREALGLVEGQLQEKHVQVKVETELPSVYGDRARLVQVVQNLVDNAAKFMKDQQHPRIEIGVIQADRGAVFFVRDNGAGIEPEYFERIFGLFNKLDTLSEGTGIGLALVKRIIEVHGGTIWVESELGKGATFYFTLANKKQEETV